MTYIILQGNCLDVLATIPSNLIQTCVTSPPYFGLRDYGVTSQIGLEPTPQAYVESMVNVFRQVRRTLRDDGTLWLNLGDSYNAYNGGAGPSSSLSRGAQTKERPKLETGYGLRFKGLKPKDLLGVPWRVALALQEDGWYLRQDIIWHKPNPMPESVRDRCTKAHEYIFLLSKSEKYFFDAEVIKEPAVGFTEHDLTGPGYAAPGQTPQTGSRRKGNARSFRGGGTYTQGQSFDNSAVVERESTGNVPNKTGLRNKRSVWTVSPKPFKEAHFATFPPDLIRPCILAGAPIGKLVLDPFGGAGTTALVAESLARHSISIELNPDYVTMARARVEASKLPVSKPLDIRSNLSI